MEQQTNSKAAANVREIIFEHQQDKMTEFNDIYRYITEYGQNTNTVESLDFTNANSITLVSMNAPDIYTIYFQDGNLIAACDELSWNTWLI
ncbi:hypothetical protein CBW53_22560 [Yersinia frederiksenii]|nr:hypothetical protein CBW53_22560 [Yersinia frederiksenii]